LKKEKVVHELCKMLGEVAGRMGSESSCICDQGGAINAIGEVPDAVISEMWELIADGYLHRKTRDIPR
jgi:hypothetical protein